jgi:hypothetical protein
MKKLIWVIAFIFFASYAYADSAIYNKRGQGGLEVHVWQWTSTDGTFDLNDNTSNSEQIWGAIIGVHFDPGAANQPDADHTIYLYDSRFNFDWLFAKGANLDGTSRTASANVRTPVTTDSSYPVLYGVKLRPYVTGPGAGTRSGTIYLIVRIYPKEK